MKFFLKLVGIGPFCAPSLLSKGYSIHGKIKGRKVTGKTRPKIWLT